MAYVDNVLETISAVAGSGLGDVTLSGAVDATYRALGAADDGLSFEVTFVEPGTGTETRAGCVYTHSGRTLSRGTLLSSTTGSAITLTTAATAAVVVSAASLTNVIFRHVAGPDANTTMEAGVCYEVDLGTFTATRTYTLPATARVGDRVQILVTAGSATREVIVTAGSGDTLNGVAGGTEWSRLLITGETLTLKCVAADSAWMVEVDGRIPCNAVMAAASAQTGIASATWITLTQGASGSWSVSPNVGSIADTANHALVARRAGNYEAAIVFAVAVLGDQLSLLAGFRKNGTGNPRRVCRLATSAASSATVGGGGSLLSVLAVGDYFQAQVLHTDSVSKSTEYISGESMVTFSMKEIL
jgi:hypothetical protein